MSGGTGGPKRRALSILEAFGDAFLFPSSTSPTTLPFVFNFTHTKMSGRSVDQRRQPSREIEKMQQAPRSNPTSALPQGNQARTSSNQARTSSNQPARQSNPPAPEQDAIFPARIVNWAEYDMVKEQSFACNELARLHHRKHDEANSEHWFQKAMCVSNPDCCHCQRF